MCIRVESHVQIKRKLHSQKKVSGTVDLTRLPQHLSSLHLNKNPFIGETDFSQIPKSMGFLNIAKTNLSGTIYGGEAKIGVVSVSRSHVKYIP